MRVLSLRQTQPSETRTEHAGRLPKISVVVADDCLIYRKGLVALIGSECDFVVVGETSNPPEALAFLRSLRPNILIFGCKLLTTTASAPFVIPTRSGTRSIMIVDTPLSREQSLRLIARHPGLSGIVPRHVEAEALMSSMRVVHSGGNWTGFEAPVEPEPTAFETKRGLELTGRHVEVARLLARGCCNKEIAKELGISDATVKKHVRALFARLGLKDRLQVALHVNEHWELFADFQDTVPGHESTGTAR